MSLPIAIDRPASYRSKCAGDCGAPVLPGQLMHWEKRDGVTLSWHSACFARSGDQAFYTASPSDLYAPEPDTTTRFCPDCGTVLPRSYTESACLLCRNEAAITYPVLVAKLARRFGHAPAYHAVARFILRDLVSHPALGYPVVKDADGKWTGFDFEATPYGVDPTLQAAITLREAFPALDESQAQRIIWAVTSADPALLAAADAAALAVGKLPEPDPPSPSFPVRPGYYTVEHTDGSHHTFRFVERPDRFDRDGRPMQFVALLTGSDNTSDYRPVATYRPHRNGLTINTAYRGDDSPMVYALRYLVSADRGAQVAAGIAYALESKLCFICNRRLTDTPSLTAGYGPTCAENWGLPWGAKLPVGASVVDAPDPAISAPVHNAAVAPHDAEIPALTPDSVLRGPIAANDPATAFLAATVAAVGPISPKAKRAPARRSSRSTLSAAERLAHDNAQRAAVDAAIAAGTFGGHAN